MKILRPLRKNSNLMRLHISEDGDRLQYAVHYSNCTPQEHILEPKYIDYTYDDYINHGVQFIEPMNAKEVTDQQALDDMFNSADYILEDKLDGTRATVHFQKDAVTGESTTRVFSRRVSVKTNWLSENSDSLPQFSLMSIPELDGTVIDGELRMPDYEFKEVSSTLNCTWDKAIHRQLELNFIKLFTFDIIQYKGRDTTNLPLTERKELLHKVVSIIDSHYEDSPVVMLPYYDTLKIPVYISKELMGKIIEQKDTYANLYDSVQQFLDDNESFNNMYCISRKAYYEYVVIRGGEGVMLKPKNEKYYCGARKNAFMKVKKFLTRECVILGFSAPTKEYKGKYPNPEVWRYWEIDLLSGGCVVIDTENEPDAIGDIKKYPKYYTPVSKYYAEGWVGNIIAGVHITDEEVAKLPKKCHKDITYLNDEKYLIVAEISGYDEPLREYFTQHQDEMLGKVVEIKANEIFKDTGRLRHPRFLRLRTDKASSQCTFKDHIFA